MYGCDVIDVPDFMYYVHCYACVASHESIEEIARNLFVNIADQPHSGEFADQ
jgi:hypothetical protein